MQSYKKLTAWKKSIDLVEEIYNLTSQFSKEDTHGLSIQTRRAAASIPSNIAEESRRKDLPEYLQFSRFADASSAEFETQLIISKRMYRSYKSADFSRTEPLLEEVQKMLNILLRKLGEKLTQEKGTIRKPKSASNLQSNT